MILRPYQHECVEAIWSHIRTKATNPVAVLPTGSGKSAVQAQIAKDVIGWGGRVLFLSHVKELVSQVAEHIRAIAPEVPVGIYSAGLGERDLGYSVTVGGIQSLFERASEIGKVDIVAVDECHRVKPDSEGMYGTLLQGLKEINPAVRFLGLSATPYRTSSGSICRKDGIFQEIAYEVGIRELIRDGYLCELRSKAGDEKPQLSGVHVRGGEFVQDELEAAMNDDRKVALAVMEILEKTANRKSVLVFCVGIDHANKTAAMLREMDDRTRTIFGETPAQERAETIKAFKAGEVKFLVNVDVLTTGFDSPGIDAIAILRPTLSPGLWYQMCGRGFRIAPGKKDCYVLDFGGNALRHGPVDQIRAPKDGKENNKAFRECPQCNEVVPYSREVCTDCGFVFQKEERTGRGINHDGTASDASVLSDGKPDTYTVNRVWYKKHYKKDAPDDHPPTLMVGYECGLSTFREWVCVQHTNFARTKAVQWWKLRSAEPCPTTVDAALALINTKGIKEAGMIEVSIEGKYTKVSRAWEFRDKPKPVEKPKETPVEIVAEDIGYSKDQEEIPF